MSAVAPPSSLKSRMGVGEVHREGRGRGRPPTREEERPRSTMKVPGALADLSVAGRSAHLALGAGAEPRRSEPWLIFRSPGEALIRRRQVGSTSREVDEGRSEGAAMGERCGALGGGAREPWQIIRSPGESARQASGRQCLPGGVGPRKAWGSGTSRTVDEVDEWRLG